MHDAYLKEYILTTPRFHFFLAPTQFFAVDGIAIW